MEFIDFAKRARLVDMPMEMELARPILWLHDLHLPFGVISLRENTRPFIKLPEKVINKYGNIVKFIAISAKAFSGHEEITDIALPTTIQAFPEKAFYGCKNLKNITFPKQVKVIRADTFAGCESLENVYFEGSEEDWKAIKCAEGNEALKKAKIHFGCILRWIKTPVLHLEAEDNRDMCNSRYHLIG